MSLFITARDSRVQEFTANLAQAAATYDLCTASGDLLIKRVTIYVATAGAVFTSCAIATNQTTPFALMSAVEGAVANLTAQKTMNNAGTALALQGLTLRSGQKVQYTMVGALGTGSLRVVFEYQPISSGASLS